VPPNLTAPSAAYKRHAWLAMLGLAGFISLYFALSAWFAWTAWRLLGGMFAPDGEFEFLGFFAGVCAAFLAVFMLKALFFIQHRYDIDDIEVTRAEQPRLFEFIDRLADEARAPRAHKVFLSPRVNAAVFYDLSLLNLIVPSKKNLEIGLGLVNVVSLGELKAVLAHEFGHFAQRSMAVGRWVYIARQIAGHVVARRDALDKLLAQLSRLDLRIAWVGWILSIIVWSIRSMMDVLFRVVLLAERALSRQMEFQADLVAVSLTGSDALIHALHRLHAADDAWDKTLSFANKEAGNKRGVTDLFAVQSRIIERMREILNQPDYGVVPPLPPTERDCHRVFKSELAQPPRMWLTHPPSSDREQNAKSQYVEAPVDERSAWELFDGPQELKEKMSAHVFSSVEKIEATPMEKSFENLEKLYGRAFLDRKYHGIYLNRSPVRHAQSVAELYGPVPAGEELARSLTALYPQTLARDIETLSEKLEQKYALQALRDEIAQAPGGVIRHNGEELRRADLPRAIAVLDREIASVRSTIEAHDKRCRTTHLGAARSLEKGWPEYLQGLAAALHYADHSEANLRDAQGYVANIYSIVTADGRVGANELKRLIKGCEELYHTLNAIYAHVPQISLDRTLLRRLEAESWAKVLEEFKLPPPNHENIGEWLNVIDSWVGGTLHVLSLLRDAALEQLLLAESQVAKIAQTVVEKPKVKPTEAPPASKLPAEYRTLLPGKERPRQKRLDWWDRFQTADGVVPAIARSGVAMTVVGGVIAVGAHVGNSSLTIFNALSQPVTIQVDGQRRLVSPYTPVTLDIPQSGKVTVKAFTEKDQLIESFEEKLTGANSRYVYNVASAVPLFQWTAVYTEAGTGQEAPDERPLGTVRWSITHVDHVFEEPPQSIQIKENAAGYRDVLSAAWQAPPEQQAEFAGSAASRNQLILAHARWDATNAAHIVEWLRLGSELPGFDAVFAARLKESPSDVMLLRFEQDNAGEKRGEVCARHQAHAAGNPTDANFAYLGIRCLDDDPQQAEKFLAAHARWPEHPWLTLAAAATHAAIGDYAAAGPLYDHAHRRLPAMREYLAMEVARLRRLNADDADPDLADLARQSSQVGMFTAIESGKDVAGTPLEAYAALARGQLEDAVRLAKESNPGDKSVMWLAAASDGASRQLVHSALTLPVDEDADVTCMLAMYGVAVRERRDYTRYARRIGAALGPEVGPAMLAFLDQVRLGADPLLARESLPAMDLRMRLAAQNAALLMLGARTPMGWREEISRGLFIGEREYLYDASRDDSPRRRNREKQSRETRSASLIKTPG
jgi:Zn-dependent protease with chaperone function